VPSPPLLKNEDDADNPKEKQVLVEYGHEASIRILISEALSGHPT
jgi:hypothetical protein